MRGRHATLFTTQLVAVDMTAVLRAVWFEPGDAVAEGRFALRINEHDIKMCCNACRATQVKNPIFTWSVFGA